MTTSTTYGVTSSGFVAPTGADVFTSLTESFQQQFGTIETAPQSITGQFIAIFSQAIIELWQAMQACYNASYPATAQGVALDGIAQLVGITRKPATKTTTYIACTGTEGTVIPALSLVASTTSVFATETTIDISANRLCLLEIDTPTAPTAVPYTVTINNTPCTYAWVLYTFSAPLITGNIVDVSVAAVPIPSVPFATDSQTTLNNVAAAINGVVSSLATASAPSATTLLIAPVGVPVDVLIVVTGGASQPTVSNGYAAPATQADITNGLISCINSTVSSAAVASAINSGTLLVQALFFGAPYSAIVSSPLVTGSISSPSLVAAQIVGATPAAANTITTIVSPIYGWSECNNPLAPTIGSSVESDSTLRSRIFSASSSSAYATVSAITSRLLAIAGVSYVEVLENTSLSQLPTIITFSNDFAVGNTISISLNGISAVSVLYSGSQASTMAAITSQLQQYPAVQSATYSGDVVTANWRTISYTEITAASVSGGTAPPSVTWVDGIPPLAIKCVVFGGAQQTIADGIYGAKAAGVQTSGNVSTPVTTPSNGTTTIYYQTPQPLYIWVSCVYNGSATPASVAAAILAYGLTLGVGEDVNQYLIASVPATVSGVTKVVSMQLSFTQIPTDTPSFSTNDVVISNVQISSWDAVRIQAST